MTNEEAMLILQEKINSAEKTKKTKTTTTDQEAKSILIKKVSNDITPTIKKVPNIQKPIKQQTTKIDNKYQGQFVTLPFGLFRDNELYSKLHKCIPIYLYLQTCVFRGEHSKDKFDLYRRFYIRALLVASVPSNTIAKIHGLGPNKTREILNLLIEYNFIKKIKIATKYKKDGKWINGQQNVYILGTHSMGKPKYLASNIPFCESPIDKD